MSSEQTEGHKETPAERKARLANDPRRGKSTQAFVKNGKDNHGGSGPSHREKTGEQRGGSLKRRHTRH